MLHQLLRNALQYSAPQTPIKVLVEQRGDTAVVAITDYGIGIPARDLGTIFQRSFRGSNIDTNNISGLGMGLYFVKEIVTQHGGTIEVDSTEAHGSTFTFSLPLVAHERDKRS